MPALACPNAYAVLRYILRHTAGHVEGYRSEFQAEYEDFLRATGIKSVNTLKKCLKKLEEFGLILTPETVSKSLRIYCINAFYSVDLPSKNDGKTGDLPSKNDGLGEPCRQNLMGNEDLPSKNDGKTGDLPSKNDGNAETHIFKTLKPLKTLKTGGTETGVGTAPTDKPPPDSTQNSPDPYFLAFCEVCRIATPFTDQMGEWLFEAVSLTKSAHPPRTVEQVREFGRRVRRSKPDALIRPAEIVDKWGAIMGNLAPPDASQQDAVRQAQRKQTESDIVKENLAKYERKLANGHDPIQQAKTHSGVP